MIKLRQIADSFSNTGLLVGLSFFCVSLTPSLLPREYIVQGVMSGVVFVAGYGIGWFGHWLWEFMELTQVTGRLARVTTLILLSILIIISSFTLNQMSIWQDSIRLLMEMESIEKSYPMIVLCIALITALLIILVMRFLLLITIRVVNVINRYLPRRVSIVVGSTLLVLLLLSFVDGIILKKSLEIMDESFAAINKLLDVEYEQPEDDLASGNAQSLISWTDIGRNGKRFVADGPSKEDIATVLGRKAIRPIRIYAGFSTGENLEERAQIALAEMKRVGGFNRSILVIATATGTGWLDPSAVDPVEFLHAGDITTVTLQYSYLPSWLTLMVEPDLAREAGSALFNAVYSHWLTLPHDKRPRLYLHGLSLGALGSADSYDLITTITAPVSGALWSGPPFLSKIWRAITLLSNPESPQWRPIIRDSSAIRFMTQDGFPDLEEAKWGGLRVVYVQHASDPMTFFSTDLAYKSPDWLGLDRGRDVSPYLRWFPIVSFLQIAFDIPMATSVPLGYGHNFAPAEYIDAWIEVTQPKNWTDSDTEKVKAHFKGFNPRPT